jgi:hypothetical protein
MMYKNIPQNLNDVTKKFFLRKKLVTYRTFLGMKMGKS